ncbi:folylpolyglutamate synthase/dihydrofolate synthase family protein [Synechococcus sp. PCC 7336]|uniref:bifunctional folylpolyglutamate synthase/dihydrofolate synthase n=1 Tax=Synechococcus sp. PCC 7336 TaxID=195250 RepID=UPI000344B4CA|nr:folylpolyglutamate synthase/dihydrofolate synthase family protein [Synechococcus sp. PCC 7336]
MTASANLPPELEHFSPAAYLNSLGRFGVQLGLERMRALLKVSGQPQRGIPAIHVAGTNGKGSACAMLDAILSRSHYKTGRYTSPHLVTWQERICINGNPISDRDWRDALWQVKSFLDRYPTQLEPPTQFEIVTAAAWVYFQQQQVDCAILEVGLGGRLDATNAEIDSCLSLIVSIGRDHWQRLGNTLAEIAAEKAGIMRPGVPAIAAPQVPEVTQVLLQTAAQKGVPLQQVEPASWIEDSTIAWNGSRYRLSLQGDAQLENAAVVLAAVEQLRDRGWRIPATAVRDGLAHTTWPGRLQWSQLGDRKVLLDGSHNVPAAQILRQYVDRHFPQQAIAWCIGILATKDAEGILQILLRPGDRLYTLPIADHLALSPDELLTLARQVQPHLSLGRSLTSLDPLLSAITSQPTASTPVVICGSLYLLGQIMERYSL